MGVIAAIIGGLISLFIRKKFSPQFVVLNVGSLIVGGLALIILGAYGCFLSTVHYMTPF